MAICGRSPQQIVPAAVRALAAFCRVGGTSSLYRTPAWPDPADPPFCNAVAVLETAPPPEALLEAMHAIEAGFGRRRSRRNAPRTLDLDLLDYEGRIFTSASLTLPHPGILERAFVLIPLAEVAPAWRHPVTGALAADLAQACRAQASDVTRIGPMDSG